MNLSPLPIQKFFANNGRPLDGGLLFTYIAGTTTKIDTFSNQAGTPNTNPIELNFRGEASIWLDLSQTYKFVLAPEGDTDPPTNPIWTVDNISPSVSVADLTAEFIGQILYPRTAAEIAEGVTPVSYRYPSGYAWRQLTTAQIADVVAGNLSMDVTIPLQTWGDLCIASGLTGYLHAGSYGTTAELLFSLPGNRTNQDFSIYGDGVGKTRICRIGSQTSLMKIQSSVSGGGGNPSEANILLRSFALCADEVGSTPLYDCDGLTIQDCAIWTLQNVRTQYCRYNLYIDGSIIGSIVDSNLSDGRLGIIARNTNPSDQSDCNTITMSGTTLIKNNLEYGMDIGQASMVYGAPGVNVERNGIAAGAVTISQASPGVITYTASGLLVNMPVVFTTTGGLPTGLTVGTTYYLKTKLTPNTFTVSATIGGAAINTSSAGSGNHTCTPQTHQIIVRDTCDDLIGVAAVHFEGLWIEGGLGGWGLYNEGLAEGVVSIEKCELLMTNAIKCVGGKDMVISNMAHSASSLYDITSEFATIENTAINAITDGVTYPDYRNFRTASVVHANGRVLNYTGTLTECTTAPTGTIRSIQRGKTVSLFLDAALTAASGNTNAPTITGMPAIIRPSVTKSISGWNTDASVDKASQVQILSTGVISLANGASGLFTAAGSKGSQYFRGDYEVA